MSNRRITIPRLGADYHRDELRTLTRRSAPRLAVAAATGVVVGLAVAVFDQVVAEQILPEVFEAPLWVVAIAPGIGLLVAAIVLLSVGGGTSPSTADEYLREFHDPAARTSPRQLGARLLAAVATVGSGGPMGLEGPSIHIGASAGGWIQRRAPRLFRGTDRRTLMVAGAAAAVAAIFKAPATGVVFALEVPYQDDLARRMLLPALVSGASGYLVFVAVNGTEPILRVVGDPGFGWRDLAAAVVLGALAGFGARAFALALRKAKRFSVRAHPIARALLAGAVLAGLFVVVRALTDESLTVGPGYRTIRWAIEADHSVWLVLAVLALRCVATVVMVGGGGVGGVFIPLVVAGALLGRAVGGTIDAVDTSLFTMIGMAAFLGAGYRVPLAAVMFVAETTGQASFVVPGLLAAVAAELVMGPASVTSYQARSD